MSSLTHFTASGAAHMVDVGGKPATARLAVAEGWITMAPATLALIANGNHTKGDVLGVARIAGIMAAKRTAELIPLCHLLALSKVEIDFETQKEAAAVYCRATVATIGQTGIEIEALCAVQISLLTVYDMCKAVDRSMTITNVRLLEKSGGQSGHWLRNSPPVLSSL